LPATGLDVLHDLVDGQVGGLRGLFQVLDREMSGIPMIVMHLATPTRDTHVTGSFPERPPEALPHHEDVTGDPAPPAPPHVASAMGTTEHGALRFHTGADDRGATMMAGGCNGVDRTVDVIQHRRPAVYYALSGARQSLFAPDAAADSSRIASPIYSAGAIVGYLSDLPSGSPGFVTNATAVLSRGRQTIAP
jgi:hypothetical protein